MLEADCPLLCISLNNTSKNDSVETRLQTGEWRCTENCRTNCWKTWAGMLITSSTQWNITSSHVTWGTCRWQLSVKQTECSWYLSMRTGCHVQTVPQSFQWPRQTVAHTTCLCDVETCPSRSEELFLTDGQTDRQTDRQTDSVIKHITEVHEPLGAPPHTPTHTRSHTYISRYFHILAALLVSK